MSSTSRLKCFIFMIASLIWTVLFTFIMIAPNVLAKIEEYNNTSYYEKSNFDFEVFGPSRDQITEFQSNQNIEHVSPFSYSKLMFSDQKTVTYDFYAFENTEDFKYSPFTQNRVVSVVEDETDGLYIDCILAKESGLKLGSKVDYFTRGKSCSATVIGILEPLPQNVHGYAVGVYDRSVFGDISNNVFIKAKDIKKVDDELRTYQPLSTKKTRDEFQSDESYASYLEFFNKTNYYEQIHKLAESGSSVLSEADKIVQKADHMILSAVVLIILFITGTAFLTDVVLKNRIKEDLISGAKVKKLIRISVISILISIVIISLSGGAIIGFYPYNAWLVPQNIIWNGILSVFWGSVFAGIGTITTEYLMVHHINKQRKSRQNYNRNHKKEAD